MFMRGIRRPSVQLLRSTVQARPPKNEGAVNDEYAQIYNLETMSDDPTLFHPAIEPFKALWQKLRIASVAVLRNGRWISISTRVALSHMDSEPEFSVRPTSDFIGFSSDAPLSALDDLLQSINTKGSFKARVADEDFDIFLTLAHANPQTNPQQVQLGPPFSNINHEHHGSFESGESRFRLSNINVEYQYNVINYDQLNEISSKLRVHSPPFNGVTDLLRHLGAPFDKHQNQTSLEIVAPLPFSMTCSDSTVVVSAPCAAMRELRVIGFFDTGQATAQLSEANETGGADRARLGHASGPIPWPEKSRRGTLFLYFQNHEVGAVSVRRWMGTPNWRLQVQEFFDPGHAIFKRGIEARKEQTEFELAVTRLLTELQMPTIWYGDRQFQDRPDLAACLELKNEWIVVLGECTVQKPSVKFTPLLTRKRELESSLQGDVRILAAVFTSSTLSSADKEQARQDGIVLVGADELAALLQGVNQEWSLAQVINYFNGLLTAPLELPIRWES
jgi:hypothetical protein